MAMRSAKGLGALCGECRGSTAAGVATAANPAAEVVVGTFLHGSRLLFIPSAPLFGHPAGVLLLYLSS